jgi:hypothetical protein
LAKGIEKLAASPDLRREFGHRSRALIEGWSMAKAADGIIEAAGSDAKRSFGSR